MRSLRLLCAAGAIALLASGCTSGTRGNNGDTVVVAQQWEPMSLNPMLENGTSSTEWGLLLFQYLVKFDDTGQMIGDAATQVPSLTNGGISPDGRTVTYHLRKNLRFADGVPLTARDCVWSIGAVLNPDNNAQSRYGYDRVVSAQAPDPYTLVLHLKEPFGPLMTLVLAPQGFPILPEHVLSRYHDINHVDFNQHPIGSGPYVVTQWNRGDRVEMRPNPYYYRGAPKIPHLIVRFVPDTNTAINLLHTREADGFFDNQDRETYPELRQIPGIVTTATPMNAVGAIIFNTQDPLTSDARVRHALAEAMNVPAMVEKTYRGAEPPSGAGRGLFIWAYSPADYPDIPYDPKHAAQLLDQAGWKMGTDGVRHKDGRTLDLLFIIQAQTPGDQIIGNFVADAERQVGVRVTLKQFNITQFVAPSNLGGPVYGGKFQMALYPFVNGDDPDTTDQFACDRVPPKGYNKSRICEPAIDALLEQGRSTFDIPRRKVVYAQLQRVLYAQLPIALIYQRRQINSFSARIKNQTTSLSGAFWNAGAWTLAAP
jgi:peptide/nickel transport system substrate-binding protein